MLVDDLRSIMQAVERKHHINIFFFGQGASEVKAVLKQSYPGMEFYENSDEEFVDSEDSPAMSSIKTEITAGIRLRIRRQNKGLSQKALSEKTGIAVSNISLMENGKRQIGAKTARTLALALDCNFAELIS